MHGWSPDKTGKVTSRLGKPLTAQEREQAEVEKLAEMIVVTVEDPWASGGIIDITEQFVSSD